MATGGSSTENMSECVECLVCKERVKDLHALSSGSSVCKDCREAVVPEGTTKSPTCREVTHGHHRSKATDLPQLEGATSPQGGAFAGLAHAKPPQVIRYCGPCGDNNVIATFFCTQCSINLCQDCLHSHSNMLPSHRCVPLTDSIYCTTHVKAIVVSYCEDCQKGICVHCASEEHASHHIVDIDNVAKQRRERLLKFIQTQSAFDDIGTLQHVQAKLEDAKNRDRKFTDSVTSTRKLLKELEIKLDQVKLETQAKLASEIRNLTAQETNTENMIAERQNMIHQTVLSSGNSQLGAADGPHSMPTASSTQNPDPASVELPVLDETFPDMCTQLEQMVNDCEMEFTKEKIVKDKHIDDDC